MARLLITGGAGFIGSHTCVVLLQAGHNLLVLDDFPREDVHLMIIPQPVNSKRRSSNELDPQAEARFAHRMGGGDGEQFGTPITTPMGTPWR